MAGGAWNGGKRDEDDNVRFANSLERSERNGGGAFCPPAWCGVRTLPMGGLRGFRTASFRKPGRASRGHDGGCPVQFRRYGPSIPVRSPRVGGQGDAGGEADGELLTGAGPCWPRRSRARGVSVPEFAERRIQGKAWFPLHRLCQTLHQGGYFL